jgi:phage-related protein
VHRAVCTVKYAEAVFVLRSFQNKSKGDRHSEVRNGHHSDVIRARLKVAEALVQELRNEKTNH